MKKRRIAAVLVCVMMLSPAPITMLAADASPQGFFCFAAGAGVEANELSKICTEPCDINPVRSPLTQTERQTDGSPLDAEGGTPRFSDVAETHWAYAYVEYLASLNFVNGKTQERFFPEEPVTRGEFVTILARMCDVDLTSAYSGMFTDIDPRQYYAPAVDWAMRACITAGTSEMSFSPSEEITRQEAAAMIARYVQYRNDSLAHSNEPQEFQDETEIADYAKQAVSLMRRANIITGYENGKFCPKKETTRAEAAKMLAVVYRSIQGS